MQVHDTPVRLDSEDFAVTVNVGSGGAGVYYGTSSDPVVLASSGTLVAAGSSFALTTPVWVVSATHGQTADLQLISSTEPSADTTAVTDVRVTSQPVMPESYGARGDGNEHTLGNLYPNLGAAQTAYGGALAPYINSANWTLASIDYLAQRAAFAAAQAGGAAGAANNGVLELMPNRAYVMGGGSGVVNSQPLQFNPNSDPTKRTVVRLNGACVQLSANVTTLFGFGRTADYQTFQGIEIHDALVDCNSIGESSAVLLGTLRSGSHTNAGQRANFKHIQVYNPRGVNIPTNDASYARQFISIASQHVHTNEGDANWNPNGGSQTSLEHILVENPRIDGGAYGVALIGVLGTAHTSGAVIASIDGTRKILTFSGKTAGSFIVGEWVNMGVGPVYQRGQITAVVDNGDGTGTVTVNSAVSTTLATAVTSAANTLPIVMGLQTNIWLDDIIVRGGYHDTGQTPSPGTTTGGNNVQVGGNGFGRTCIVEDFRGVNCHDDAIEIDSMLDAQCKNVEIIDPQNVAFLPRNFCVPQTKDNNTAGLQQDADFTDCRVKLLNYNPTTSGRATGWVPAYDAVPPGPQFGTVRLTGCRYFNHTANLRIPGQAVDSYNGATSFTQLVIRDMEIVHGTGSDATPAATIGLIHIANKVDCTVEIDGVRTAFFGTATGTVTAAQHIFATAYTLNGLAAQTMHLVVRGANEAYPGLSSVTTGAIRHLVVGAGISGFASANLHADVEGLAWRSGGFGDSQPKTLVIGGASALTTASRIDFDKLNNIQRSGGMLLFFSDGSTPSSLYRRVRGGRKNRIGAQISNVLGAAITGPDPAVYTPAAANGSTAIPAGGPSWTWINDTNFDATVFVSGSTGGTAIDFSQDAGSTFPVNLLTQASAAFPAWTSPLLKPGEAIRLTYSAGTPTVNVRIHT